MEVQVRHLDAARFDTVVPVPVECKLGNRCHGGVQDRLWNRVMAEITAQMLMHRDVMSRMFVMEPMRAIPVIVLVLCKLSTSIPSSLREFRSLERCSSTRERFRWGRNAEGQMELALL